MRSFADRVRHAVSFEILGLLLVTPLGAVVFDLPIAHLGVVTAGSAILALLWTYGYNLIFDRTLQRLAGTTRKRLGQRIVHAVLFEIGLLALLLPFIAWWLGLSLWQALLMDLGFSAFYMAYAFAFNWGYDRLFPLPEWQDQP